ncbi:MAG: FtsX-like permease family protein [Thermoanaerobaculia bacterium]
MAIGPILRAMTRSKTKVALLVLEIAFTTAVVLNCLAMIRDQRARISRPSGIDEAGMIVVRMRPWGDAYGDEQFRRGRIDRDVAALKALPEVVDATAMAPVPLQGGGSSSTFKKLGAEDAQRVRAPVYYADENVFSTLGLELVEGRALTVADRPTTSGSQILNCVVTRDFADAVFPGESPIGKLVDGGSPEYPDVVVGVVSRMVTPYGGGPMESRIIIYPGGAPPAASQSLLVRARPGQLATAMRLADETLHKEDAEREITVQSLAEVKGAGYAQNIVLAKVLGWISVLLLSVTALGIYGTTSFAVTQRTKQIGTRRALGASRGEILGHFLVENSLIAGMGIALGLVAAVALNILLVTHFAGGKLDPVLVLAGVLLLWLVGVAATVVPARRASRLSPALATRTV